MSPYIWFGFLLIYCCVAYAQKTTNNSDQISITNLHNRFSMLEKAVGKMLTGKDNRSLGNVSAIKIPHQGIPTFNTTPVAFSARSGGRTGISSGFILKFNTVLTNLGNHYNPTDGIFIAPVHGIYMFHWTMNCKTYGSNNCGTSLRVNNAQIGIIRSSEDANNYYHTGSSSVVVEVQAGQHVWIQTEDWSNVYIFEWSSFGGCLLSMLLCSDVLFSGFLIDNDNILMFIHI